MPVHGGEKKVDNVGNGRGEESGSVRQLDKGAHDASTSIGEEGKQPKQPLEQPAADGHHRKRNAIVNGQDADIGEYPYFGTLSS